MKTMCILVTLHILPCECTHLLQFIKIGAVDSLFDLQRLAADAVFEIELL